MKLEASFFLDSDSVIRTLSVNIWGVTVTSTRTRTTFFLIWVTNTFTIAHRPWRISCYA